MIETKLRGIGQAHAKMILGGEHSVVQGKPAIVLPLPLNVKVETLLIESPNESHVCYIKSDFLEGSSFDHPRPLEGYFVMVDFIQNTLKIKEEKRLLAITIDSDIPIGSGFGSSAAVALAIAKSVFDVYQVEPNKKDLFKAVHLAEGFAHGNPSGLDMLGSYYMEPLLFKKGKNAMEFSVEKLSFREPLSFVIGLSGIVIETKEVVEKVGIRFKNHPHEIGKLFRDIEEIVTEMAVNWKDSNYKQLGKNMTRNHELLQYLGVSSPGLDALVKSALNAGALGCKLSGKGIGGAVIALTDGLDEAREIGEKLLSSGAVSCYIYHLDQSAMVFKVLTKQTKEMKP